MKSKTAAIEMSVGTIVTIVLLMTTLILGLVLVRNIFTGSVENINSIDQAVKNEINKLFAEDDARKIVVYPATREISIRKGDDGGFGFSIRNTEEDAGSFTYSVDAVGSSCDISNSEAEDLIILGRERRRGEGITISSGGSLDQPILVKFSIPESVPLCSIRYDLTVEKDNTLYTDSPLSVDLKIEAS
ncbi:hypothetical protein HYT25_00920 [Candidatus Pacearchaeota archaeon]|nr:hypothetical protein [Candidatus Pacearchaeota archaeon]